MDAGWRPKLGESVVMVLAVAVVARAAWELMAPLVPALIAFLVIFRLVGLVLKGSHYR